MLDVQFHIMAIKVNGIENSSAFNVGTNLLIGFGSATKSLVGNGKANGDHAGIPTLMNYIDDQDLIDTPIWHGELFQPAPYT